jgi:RNA polymerase sigma-70 factor, ECF subfamily
MIPSTRRYDSQSDTALVARVKDGDASAFEQIVRQHARQVFVFALRITKCREDAEDITQEVFLKAFRKLHEFRGKSKLSTWLVRIAVNESLMRLRRRRYEGTLAIDENVSTDEGFIPREFVEFRPNPEQLYNQSELSELLLKSIERLPQGIRTVFTLRDVENLSTKETAEVLGLSVPAVKTRLLRARIELRMRLGDGVPPFGRQRRGRRCSFKPDCKEPNPRRGQDSNGR